MVDLRIEDKGQYVEKRFVLMNGKKKVGSYSRWKLAVAALHEEEKSADSKGSFEKPKAGLRRRKKKDA